MITCQGRATLAQPSCNTKNRASQDVSWIKANVRRRRCYHYVFMFVQWSHDWRPSNFLISSDNILGKTYCYMRYRRSLVKRISSHQAHSHCLCEIRDSTVCLWYLRKRHSPVRSQHRQKIWEYYVFPMQV